ncbi:hypothetical protein MTBLM1_30250 [Rhodospirillaceae bacterium LM-1]|nr:hypothetical protein MTBLM1_30250 [Rhodospirillaceae bacterium LM-1]
MRESLAYPLSWPKEAVVTIRSILLDMDKPMLAGWPVSLSAPLAGSDQSLPAKVKLSGPPLS